MAGSDIAALRQAIRNDAETGYHYAMGNALLAQGKFDEAAAAYHRALAILPVHPGALANLAVIHEAVGDLDGAHSLVEQARATGSDLADAAFDLGVTLDLQGRAEEAVNAFLRAITLRPEHAEAYAGLGDALMRLGRLLEAEGAYRRAIELVPRHGRATYQLNALADRYAEQGELLANADRLEDAADAYRAALALACRRYEVVTGLIQILRRLGRPQDAVLELVRAGESYAENGQYALAEAAYRDALALDPRCALAHARMGILLRVQNQLEEAVAACRRALEIDPDLAVARANLGMALHKLGRDGESVSECRRAIALAPDLGLAHFALALALESLGQLEEAETACRIALVHHPRRAIVQAHLGGLLLKRGRLEEALAEIDRSLAADPRHFVALANRARALEIMGRTKEAAQTEIGVGEVMLGRRQPEAALSAYRRAAILDPTLAGNAMLLVGEGRAMECLGLTGEAEAAYRRAIARDPFLAEAHGALAALLKVQGREAEAVAALRQARVIDPLSYR